MDLETGFFLPLEEALVTSERHEERVASFRFVLLGDAQIALFQLKLETMQGL